MKGVTNWIIKGLGRRQFPLIKNGLLFKSHISFVYLDTQPSCWGILGKETSPSWTWLTFSSLPSCVSFLALMSLTPGVRQRIMEAEFRLEQEFSRNDYWETHGHPAVAFLANWAGQKAARLFFKLTNIPILFQYCDASLQAQPRSPRVSAW